MPTIAELLTKDAIVAVLDVSERAKPRPLTAADAIDIDPESEARIEAPCVDCKTTVSIEPKVPEGTPDIPRVPICQPCARIRMTEAVQDQQNIMAIRRPATAKHKPRTTDGIKHPVTTTTKEKPVPVDFETMSDAEFGAMVRKDMKAAIAKNLPAKQKKAKAKVKAKEARRDEGIKQEQERRVGHVLPAFMVGKTLEVPELDLSAVSSLDECPDSTERSPYNKARYRLKVEGGTLNSETTTYRVLEQEHMRLMSLAADHNEAAPVKAVKAKPEAKVEEIVAVIDPDIKAKAKALAKVAGISKKQALAVLTSN